ncbi:unnamed protein product [Schistocephalus solidus]|uniref:WD_REPEATS_REGION domain-containing protein n=1 Tax=Schistocephalus solidus TaxID=70667 RepID=A0A183TD01_SCHSO|nr:unnamed protein product [Schistocephalus solidus]
MPSKHQDYLVECMFYSPLELLRAREQGDCGMSSRSHRLRSFFRRLEPIQHPGHVIRWPPNQTFKEHIQGNMWSVSTLRLESTHKHHSGCVNALNFSPSGRLIASASDDQRVAVTDFYKGTLLSKFHSGHNLNVFQVKFVPETNETQIVTGARDSMIRLAIMHEDGATAATTRCLAKHDGPCHKVSFVADEPSVFLSAGEDGCVFSIDLRETKAQKPPPEPVSCLMWEWAHSLTGRRARLRGPQHYLSPITHTPGFTYLGNKEEPSPSDSQSTGQPLDPHSKYTGPTVWSGLASGEDHVDCSSVSSEATLAFREQSLLQMSIQVIEKNAGADLSGDVQQRDSSVVVAEILSLPLSSFYSISTNPARPVEFCVCGKSESVVRVFDRRKILPDDVVGGFLYSFVPPHLASTTKVRRVQQQRTEEHHQEEEDEAHSDEDDEGGPTGTTERGGLSLQLSRHIRMLLSRDTPSWAQRSARRRLNLPSRLDPLNDHTPTKYNITAAVYSAQGDAILASFNDEDIYLFDSRDPSLPPIHSYRCHRNMDTATALSLPLIARAGCQDRVKKAGGRLRCRELVRPKTLLTGPPPELDPEEWECH